MKTAVSIPDAIVESAEALASRLGMSRSRLHATALARLIAEHERGQLVGCRDLAQSSSDVAEQPCTGSSGRQPRPARRR